MISSNTFAPYTWEYTYLYIQTPSINDLHPALYTLSLPIN